jgi:hypothetical protein
MSYWHPAYFIFFDVIVDGILKTSFPVFHCISTKKKVSHLHGTWNIWEYDGFLSIGLASYCHGNLIFFYMDIVSL